VPQKGCRIGGKSFQSLEEIPLQVDSIGLREGNAPTLSDLESPNHPQTLRFWGNAGGDLNSSYGKCRDGPHGDLYKEDRTYEE